MPLPPQRLGSSHTLLTKFFLAGIALGVVTFPILADKITTYAGSGTNGNFSHTIGFPATNADFNGLQTSIQGLAVDLSGQGVGADSWSPASSATQQPDGGWRFDVTPGWNRCGSTA